MSGLHHGLLSSSQPGRNTALFSIGSFVQDRVLKTHDSDFLTVLSLSSLAKTAVVVAWKENREFQASVRVQIERR